MKKHKWIRFYSAKYFMSSLKSCAYFDSKLWMFQMHNLFNCKLRFWLKSWKYLSIINIQLEWVCVKCPIYANPVCGKLISVDDSIFKCICGKKNNREGQLSKTLKPGIISCIFNGLVIWLELHRAEHLAHVLFWLTATNVPNNWLRWWGQHTWDCSLCCKSNCSRSVY